MIGEGPLTMEPCSSSHPDGSPETPAVENSSPSGVMSKKKLRWPKLIGINLVAFGLDLCSSAGFTYIPPLMLKAGFPDRAMTITLGIGPIVSLVVVPLVGHWSDHCTHCLGRRRPFILGLSIIMLASLLLIPFSCDLGSSRWGLLTLGVVLLDFTSQALMNPCKALVSDMILFSDYHLEELGFTIYSCMLSLGGCFGYLITSLNWGTTSFGMIMGSQEKAIFVFLAVLFFIFLVTNLTMAKEVPYRPVPTDVERPRTNDNNNNSSKKDLPPALTWGPPPPYSKLPPKRFIHYPWTGVQCHILRAWREVRRFFSLPSPLFRLFLATMMAWMGIMCHDMFYTDFVGQVIYKGRPRESLAERDLYDEGVRMGSWGLLLHCLSAALFAGLVQDKLSQRWGQGRVYLGGMVCHTVAMLGTLLTRSPLVANLCSALSGPALAVVTTVPCNLVTAYLTSREVYYPDSYGERGIGRDLAVLDSAFFLAQIIPAMFMGHLAEIFATSSVYMAAATLFGLLGCLCSRLIVYPPPPLRHL